jgi:hypothetical protein
MFKFALIVALVFSPMAAISSFLITYAEYRRHFPENLPLARRLSLNFALATFFFFVILTFLAVFAFYKFLPK